MASNATAEDPPQAKLASARALAWKPLDSIAIVLVGIVVANGSSRADIVPPPSELPTPQDPATPPPEPTTPQPEPVPTPAELARGWERRPDDGGRIPVLGAVGFGLRKSARFAVNVLAAPFRGAAWLEDHHNVYTHVRDFLYNDARTAGVVPSLGFASGFGGYLGVTAFHRDIFGHGESAAVGGNIGGADRYAAQLKLALPRLAADRLYFRSRLRFEVSDQELFQGIGNGDDPMESLAPGVATRFAEDRTLATASVGVHQGIVRTGFTLIYNKRTFDQDVSSGSTPIGEHYDVTAIRGFTGGVETRELTFDAQLDLRDQHGQTGSGALVTGFGGGHLGGEWQYAHYGAEATYYFTPWRRRRVFVIRAVHEGVSGNDLPFTELPRLGGAGLLRGYRGDRFRDELATAGTLEYRYPIHNLLSGVVFVESGKVARNYDELFGAGLRDHWHTGYGGGFVMHTAGSVVLTAEVAYGDGFEFYLTTDVLQAFRKREREL